MTTISTLYYGGFEMLHDIGDFYYDSSRLILCDKTITKDDYKIICDNIKPNDTYKEDLLYLSNAMQHQVSMKQRVVEKAGIILTFNCNLRCTYCSQNSTENSNNEVSVNDVEAFVKEIIKKRVIASIISKKERNVTFYFTGGGESTYYWDKFEKVIHIIEKLCAENNVKLNLEMATNAVFNDKQRKFIAKHFDSVMVSYDGMPETQDRNRVTSNNLPTSILVERSIKYFMNSNIDLTIRSTVWQYDLPKLPQMLNYLHEHFPKINSWEIYPVTPAGRAVPIMDSRQECSQYDFIKAYLNLIEYAEKENCLFNITSPILTCSPIGFNCGGIGADTMGAWLFPNRKISTCPDSSDVMTQIGEIKNSQVIWYDTFSDPLLEMGYEKYQTCNTCLAFRICGSGCPIKHIREKQFKTGMLSWECSMQCKLFEHILKTVMSGKNCFGWSKEKIETPLNSNIKVYKLIYSNS